MRSLIPYLVFHGNCRGAMEFYKEVLDGEITIMQTFGEAPFEVAEEFQNRIYNSEVRAGDICIKASDDLPTHKVTAGNNFSLYLVFTDKKIREKVFNELSKEGKILFPLNDNFAMLKDKFNIQWMLVLQDN